MIEQTMRMISLWTGVDGDDDIVAAASADVDC